MKIAIIGYGKMGKMIERLAVEEGHEIVSIISSSTYGNRITPETVEEADVCIEFTRPSTVVGHITELLDLGKKCVIGTTGWDEHLNSIKETILQKQGSLFYAPNFSLGMNLFIKAVQEAAGGIMPTGQYDIAGIEAHHNQKLDTPSGTAKQISNALSDIAEIPFTSIRCGSIPGTHTVLFDSPYDTITMTHTARNREGFAQGAITAAEWIQGRQGFFTMEDLLFSGETL